MSSSKRTRKTDSPPLDGVSALLERISEFPLLEIEELQAKRRARPVSDADLALALFAEEAEPLLNVSKDRSRDGRRAEVLDELLHMEEIARYDHALALALSEGRDPPPRPANLRRRKRHSVDSDDGGGVPVPNRTGRVYLEPRVGRAGKGKAVQTYEGPEAVYEETEEEWPPSECMTSTEALSRPSNGKPASPLTTTQHGNNGENSNGGAIAAHPFRLPFDAKKSFSAVPSFVSDLLSTRQAVTTHAGEQSDPEHFEMLIPGAYGRASPPLAQDRPSKEQMAAEQRVQRVVAEDQSSADTQRAPVFRSTLGQRLFQRAASSNTWPTQTARSPPPPVSQRPSSSTSAVFETCKKPLGRRVTVSTPPGGSALGAQSPSSPTMEIPVIDEARSYHIPVDNAIAKVAASRPVLPPTRFNYAPLETPEGLGETASGSSLVSHEHQFTETATSPPVSVAADTSAWQPLARGRQHLPIPIPQRVSRQIPERSPQRVLPKAREDEYSPPALTLRPVASDALEPTARGEESRKVAVLRGVLQQPNDLRPSATKHIGGREVTIWSSMAYAADRAEDMEALPEAEEDALDSHSMTMRKERHFVSGGYRERDVTQEEEVLAPVRIDEARFPSPIPVTFSETNDFAIRPSAPSSQPQEIYESVSSPREHASR
ncbi:hypothetical protein TRAPUB_10829 [Trametes pubescens]|uniref:Uncharacterized protein n=1 Tax=Trametes pubescens TaxID=154538 RepID=A0A1M2VYC4_TRAPU|nr:hypothetical protein TRAPUB_10829 [Trametes pubescens]